MKLRKILILGAVFGAGYYLKMRADALALNRQVDTMIQNNPNIF